METPCKLTDSSVFVCYFVRNQTWKTSTNQSSVAEPAALKAGELFSTEWLGGCVATA